VVLVVVVPQCLCIVSSCCRVNGCSHMPVFMAGTKIKGLYDTELV
jgi:hypothetical protein